MENCLLGLRKGAWSRDEDDLLRKCIHKYGEGKWHQVPIKAGLNRCRKSCRLRWLNYLKPNIKRGEFAEDEVDLILRLHKLLGNKWSLIAGRIPGRTANDVKNYWNTRLRKKNYHLKNHPHEMKTIHKVKPIKPQPQAFKNVRKYSEERPTIVKIQENLIKNRNCIENHLKPPPTTTTTTATTTTTIYSIPTDDNTDDIMWWQKLLAETETEEILLAETVTEEILFDKQIRSGDVGLNSGVLGHDVDKIWSFLNADLD